MANLAEIAASDVHAQWIVEHHIGQTMVEGGRPRCTYCESWWPCALVELAALAVLRHQQAEAEPAAREPISHAEFSRFVQEAQEQRARAEVAEEALAETRAHEHVLVIVGDMLARRLEWISEEPTSGFDPELIDAIKDRAARDTAQWRQAIENAGFKRPDSLAVVDQPPRDTLMDEGIVPPTFRWPTGAARTEG